MGLFQIDNFGQSRRKSNEAILNQKRSRLLGTEKLTELSFFKNFQRTKIIFLITLFLSSNWFGLELSNFLSPKFLVTTLCGC